MPTPAAKDTTLLWQILTIPEEDLPLAEAFDTLTESIGLPKDPGYLGIDGDMLRLIFQAARAIRDKYVLSRLT